MGYIRHGIFKGWYPIIMKVKFPDGDFREYGYCDVAECMDKELRLQREWDNQCEVELFIDERAHELN